MEEYKWIKNRRIKGKTSLGKTLSSLSALMKCEDCNKIRIINKCWYDRAIKNGTWTGRCKNCCSSYLINKGTKTPYYSIRDAFSKGYKGIYIPLTDKYYPEYIPKRGKGYWIGEHRYVMSKYLDRPLVKGEIVHHKNGIKDDNRIENLELITYKSTQPHNTSYAKAFQDGMFTMLYWLYMTKMLEI